MTSQGAFEFAKAIKNFNPEITVIAGGYHPTVMIKETLADSNFDFCFTEKGEITAPILLDFLNGKSKDGVSLENIQGVAFKKGGQIVINSPRLPIGNLDTVHLPAYDLINIDEYSSPSSTRKPYTTYIRSRGCPFFCNFCGVQRMFTRQYRCESPQKTIENVDYLVKNSG